MTVTYNIPATLIHRLVPVLNAGQEERVLNNDDRADAMANLKVIAEINHQLSYQHGSDTYTLILDDEEQARMLWMIRDGAMVTDYDDGADILARLSKCSHASK